MTMTWYVHDCVTVTNTASNLQLSSSDLQENVKTYGDRAPGLLSGTKLRDYPFQPETVTHNQANIPDSSSSVRHVTVVSCVFLPGPF